MSFANRVAIVTGGSSGIGASIAFALAKEGAGVAIVGRNETKLKKVADEINQVGKKPLTIKADVTIDEDLRNIVKTTIETFGSLQVLVNNAGMVTLATVLDETLPGVYDEVMNTNLRSAVLLTNFAAPYLIKTKGNIVNISSVAGTSALGGFDILGYASYCTSKAGMDHFTRVSAMELAEKGVRVNAVSPGPVETSIMDGTGVTDWNAIAAKTALKIVTQTNEVADLVLY